VAKNNILWVFDVDGVLCDNTKAAVAAGPEPDRARDKEQYSRWLETVMKDFDKHPPVGPIFLLLRRLYLDAYTPAVLLTARNEEHREKTMEWLKRQFPSSPLPRLLMRPKDNLWKSARLKEEMIKDLVGVYEAGSVVVIDDDERDELREVCQRNGWIFMKPFLPRKAM